MKIKFKGIGQKTLLTLLSQGMEVVEIARDFTPNTFTLTLEIDSKHALTVTDKVISIYDRDDVETITLTFNEYREVVIL